MSQNEKPTTNSFPWKEILGFFGVVLAAYIGYLGIRSQIEIPIQATQTAEARLTQSANASPTPSIPTEVPSPITETATPLTTSVQPVAQNVQWIPNREGIGGGLCIGWDHTAICPSDKVFIPWNQLQLELEQNVLPQVSEIPPGSSLVLHASLDGTPNSIIEVVDSSGSEQAQIWIGENPENSWSYDGLIRVGNPQNLSVWETFTRYSDGTYVKK